MVSRPACNACLLTPEGKLLSSSGHPGVKVTFPPGATREPQHVSLQVGRGGGSLKMGPGCPDMGEGSWVSVLLQVVRVSGRELQELRALLQEPEANASPLLSLSHSGPPDFLRPVTVQLPLPAGLTGG